MGGKQKKIVAIRIDIGLKFTGRMAFAFPLSCILG